jgi:hypothetical protein
MLYVLYCKLKPSMYPIVCYEVKRRSKNENKKRNNRVSNDNKNHQQSNANLPKFVMKPRDEPKREKQS